MEISQLDFQKLIDPKAGSIPNGIINAYIDKNLPSKYMRTMQERISQDEKLRELIKTKQKEKENIKVFFESPNLSFQELQELQKQVQKSLYTTVKFKETNILKKVWKFLDTPII